MVPKESPGKWNKTVVWLYGRDYSRYSSGIHQGNSRCFIPNKSIDSWKFPPEWRLRCVRECIFFHFHFSARRRKPISAWKIPRDFGMTYIRTMVVQSSLRTLQRIKDTRVSLIEVQREIELQWIYVNGFNIQEILWSCLGVKYWEKSQYKLP